jgi:hypothetical protein
MANKEEILEKISLMLSIHTGKHFVKHMELCDPKDLEAIYEAMELYSDERAKPLVEALDLITRLVPKSYDEHRIAKEALNNYNNSLKL